MNQENKESSEHQIQQAINGSNIAFKDFKKSVSNDEFLAVLNTAKKEYKILINFIESESGLKEKAQKSIDQIKGQSDGMPPGLAEKLIKGLKRKANGEMHEMFKDEIARHRYLVDFINRFQQSNEELPYLKFN